MKDFFTLIFFFSVLFSISSCKGQEKSFPKKNIIEQTTDNKSKSTPPDFDPYFTETNSIAKSYGPISITRNILQDKKGNYWFASWEGILKYDGKIFTNFTNKDSLRRYHVFSLLEDRLENIWFGTIRAGVYLYDGKTFTNFTTEHGLAHNIIGCIYEDREGNIWLGTGGGISRYNGKSFDKFVIDGGDNNNDINSIIEDEDGNFWIGTRGKAFRYDGLSFTTITKNSKGTPFTNVRSIIKDKNGDILLGGNDGLWIFKNNTFTNLSKEFIGYIYEDSKGSIWTSSTVIQDPENWVLTRYDTYFLPIENTTPDLIKPQRGMLFGIIEDSNGAIWFGYGGGVGCYNGKSFEYFKEE